MRNKEIKNKGKAWDECELHGVNQPEDEDPEKDPLKVFERTSIKEFVSSLSDAEDAEARYSSATVTKANATNVIKRNSLLLIENRKTGGTERGKQRKAEGEARTEKAIKHAEILLREGRKPHELSGIIAAQQGVTPKTIRTILQKAGILPAKGN